MRSPDFLLKNELFVESGLKLCWKCVKQGRLLVQPTGKCNLFIFQKMDENEELEIVPKLSKW